MTNTPDSIGPRCRTCNGGGLEDDRDQCFTCLHDGARHARLIAAAPDLLWLVQSWVEWPDHESGPASVAARLAKARALLTRVATGGGDE